MPNRKLVQIGDDPKLPTIREFLTEMAARQGDEIRKLKAEALGKPAPSPDGQRANLKSAAGDRLEPDPWQLHPVRKPKSQQREKKRAKSAAKRVSRPVKRTKTPAKKSSRQRVRSTR